MARAPRSPRRKSRSARRSGNSEASSPTPLTACSSPLKIRRPGENEYMRKWSPPSTPSGGGRLEGAERRVGRLAPARLVERARRAGERGDRGGLGHAADPRRRAAAPAEVVLPGQEVAAVGGEGEQRVDAGAQLAHRAGGAAARRRAVAQAGAGEPVELAPARQRLELHAAAGVVLEDRRAVVHAVAGGGERRARPELGVAAQHQEGGAQPAGLEQVGGGELVDGAQHRAELGGARAVEPADGGAGGVVLARVARVGGRRELSRQQREPQRAGDRGRALGAPDREAQPAQALGLGGGRGAPRGGLQRALVLGAADLGRRRRRRGRLGRGAAPGDEPGQKQQEGGPSPGHATASSIRSMRLTGSVRNPTDRWGQI